MAEFETGSTDRRALLAGIGGLAAGTFLSAGRAEAGPLNPTAAPSPTPGPEPRIAINETNTPGDETAVYRIVAPGSYYLTSNVNGQAGKYGIHVTAANVTLDLNGFAVIGVIGALAAIYGNADQICAQNGHVSFWPAGGVSLGARGSRVSGVSVRMCGDRGVSMGVAGLVEGCTVSDGNGDGIVVNYGSTVRGCSSTDNVGVGISISTSCVIVDSVATGCLAGGILMDGDSVVSNCVVTYNQVFGIRGHGSSGVISGNAVTRQAVGDGFGIDVQGSRYRIDSNHLGSNKIGLRVTGINNQIIRNTAMSNEDQSYAIGALNFAGPIGSPGAATSPWANLE